MADQIDELRIVFPETVEFDTELMKEVAHGIDAILENIADRTGQAFIIGGFEEKLQKDSMHKEKCIGILNLRQTL